MSYYNYACKVLVNNKNVTEVLAELAQHHTVKDKSPSNIIQFTFIVFA